MGSKVDTTATRCCGTCNFYLRNPQSKTWGKCMSRLQVMPVKIEFNQHYSNGGPHCPFYSERSDEDLAKIREMDKKEK